MSTDRQPAPRRRKHGRVPLETELAVAMDRLKNVRNRQLVARHLGWDDRPPCSLKEAGAEFHLTRERARQVYADALPLLRQNTEMPTLDAVLAFVKKRQNELVSDVEEDLGRLGFTRGRFSLRGILGAAQVFRRAPGFQLHRFGGALFIGPDLRVPRIVQNVAVKGVAHHGAVPVSEICREVSKRQGRRVDDQVVRRFLRTRADIRWLDKEGEWFSLTSVPRNRLVARVQKVLAVHPRIHISALHQAISKDYQPLKIPEPILRSFCGISPWCRVRGQYIAAEVVPAVEEILSGGEAVICDILRNHGGAMPLSELNKLCCAAGVKRSNLWRVLSFSPLIQRLGRELYGLIGAKRRARRVPGAGRTSAR